MQHTIFEVFANNIRRLRIEKGMSQEQLASKANLHRTYISDIERSCRNVSLDSLSKIAEGLDVEWSILLIDTNQGAKKK